MTLKRFVFDLDCLSKMHHGKRVSTVALNLKDALDNIRAMYPGYHYDLVN